MLFRSIKWKVNESAMFTLSPTVKVGTWNTWNGLDIKDIVWPGGSHVPPQGVPEKFHIRITFLEEPLKQHLSQGSSNLDQSRSLVALVEPALFLAGEREVPQLMTLTQTLH